jgi:hypothetical protein
MVSKNICAGSRHCYTIPYSIYIISVFKQDLDGRGRKRFPYSDAKISSRNSVGIMIRLNDASDMLNDDKRGKNDFRSGFVVIKPYLHAKRIQHYSRRNRKKCNKILLHEQSLTKLLIVVSTS